MAESKTDMSLSASFTITRQKLIVVGDIGVGKTSIVNAFLGQPFKEDYEPSIGVDFLAKTVKYKGKTLKLQIWDSAGQEKYRSIIPNYIRGSALIFLIFDITNQKSFDNIPSWVDFIKSIESSNIVLCGNKIDKEDQRKVDASQAKALATKLDIPYYEVSAKTDYNIQRMLYMSVVELPFFDQYKEESSNMTGIAEQLELENGDTKRTNTTDSRSEINISGRIFDYKEVKKHSIKCNC